MQGVDNFLCSIMISFSVKMYNLAIPLRGVSCHVALILMRSVLKVDPFEGCFMKHQPQLFYILQVLCKCQILMFYYLAKEMK